MMLRGTAVLATVVVLGLVDRAIAAAGGIETWCAFADPFIPPALTRKTYFLGANPCKIFGLDNPTSCPTSDGWGVSVQQCVYPGYNPIAQPVQYPTSAPLPGYPGTYDQTLACNHVVFTSELVDNTNTTYGILKVFKDYQDQLFVTASVRPVFFNSNSSLYQPPQLNGYQWLHTQPPVPVPFNQYAPSTPLSPASGRVLIADADTFSPSLSNVAYVNQLSISSTTPSQFWSCWTYKINTKAACNPTSSKHWISGVNGSGTGCIPNNVIDVSSSTNLYLYVEFTIVALNLFDVTDSTLGPSCGTVHTDTKTIRLPGSGVVDLYSASIGITSLFYLNGSSITASSCIAMDIIMSSVLAGRQYIRIGCDVVPGPLSQMYYKLQFTSPADRDFLYLATSNPFFWGSTVYPDLKPGCGFFGLYTQTVGNNAPFSQPVFTDAPSAEPFQATGPTATNPYYTACTSFTPANATTGTVTTVNTTVNASAVFGWAPQQNGAPFSQYSFGCSCQDDGCACPAGENRGINGPLMNKNFSAAVPFNVAADPARAAQNLNLLCGAGVRPAFGAQLFVATGTQTATSIQVGALVFSQVDQSVFMNCINTNPNTLQVIALSFGLQCTDFISIGYSCGGLPISFYSDVRCTNTGVGGNYVSIMYDTIDSAGLTSCLLGGSSDVLCSDTATGSILSVVFTRQTCATDLYIAMTSGSGVLTAGFVQSASIPCAAVLLLEAQGATIQARSCPPFAAALKQKLTAMGINAATAYPGSSVANGCSVVTPSPSAAPVRVFFKAYLDLTMAQWVMLSGPTGVVNAQFVDAAQLVCGSVMNFSPANDFAKKTVTFAELPALGSGVGICVPVPTL
eukprot:gene6119-biopygen1260